MELTNGETLFLAFAFLVPGFIAQTAKSYFLPSKEKDGTVMILGYLTFTGVNYALWSWALYLLLFTPYFFNRPFLIATLCFSMAFLSPLLIGIVAGVMQSKGTVRRVLNRVGLEPMHEFPSGWDYKFASLGEPEIVHITLDDGTQLRGLFGAGSYASVFGAEYDIYLEEVFDSRPDGGWARDPDSKGLWVSGCSVRLIEFIRVVESGGGDGKE
jgi:hypothetical protein